MSARTRRTTDEGPHCRVLRPPGKCCSHFITKLLLRSGIVECGLPPGSSGCSTGRRGDILRTAKRTTGSDVHREQLLPSHAYRSYSRVYTGIRDCKNSTALN